MLAARYQHCGLVCRAARVSYNEMICAGRGERGAGGFSANERTAGVLGIPSVRAVAEAVAAVPQVSGPGLGNSTLTPVGPPRRVNLASGMRHCRVGTAATMQGCHVSAAPGYCAA